MGVNNFKKLEELELNKVSFKPKAVRENIGANLGSIRFITNILELYFPKVIDLFVELTGGNNPGKIKNNTPNQSKYPDMR